MSRHPRGRPPRPVLPAWPALRVRALVNGLAALAGGVGLLWLCWSALGFTVFDASRIPAVVRVLSVWFAVALPVAWLAVGAHLLFAAVTAGDRELVAHGAASWDPGDHDDVLRGVRVRGWRLGRGDARRVSGPTVGWLPELSPVGPAPLAAGILALLILLAWMVRGYGLGVIALVIAILWLGWRLLRAWQSWSDVREARRRRSVDARGGRGAAEMDEGATPDEAWGDEPELAPQAGGGLRGSQPRIGAVRAARDPEEVAESTALLPLYVEDDDGRPDRRAPRGRTGARDAEPPTAQVPAVPAAEVEEPVRRGSRRTGRGQPEREVLVDRSVQRAIRARQASRGEQPREDGSPRSPSSGRGTARAARRANGRDEVRERGSRGDRQRVEQPHGLRSYLGQRSHQGEEDSGTRALRSSAVRRERTTRADAEDLSVDRTRGGDGRRGGTSAPSAAEAEQEIYGRDEPAVSLFSYLSRRRDERR